MEEVRHPGRVLLEDFIEPLGLNPNAVAVDIDIIPMTIYRFTKEETSFHGIRGAEIAIKLSNYFSEEPYDTTPEFWMELQNKYDLYIAYKSIEGDDDIDFKKPSRKTWKRATLRTVNRSKASSSEVGSSSKKTNKKNKNNNPKLLF